MVIHFSLHVQNTSILTNPLVPYSSLIILLRICGSLPMQNPDERISFNLMILICEIKDMFLIKRHYAEVGLFALKIVSI